jgi:hypothetical protein
MSLVRQLIQIALVEACRGRTIALDAVFDSRMDTLDGLLDGDRRPVLIFSIEESESRRVDQTDGLLGRPARFTVMVQAAVATGQTIEDEHGAVVLQAIGETDSALEARLNILDWQWRAALTAPGNAWAELFRNLMTEIGQIKDQRATDPETGTKHAARFTQFDLDAMPDPVPGDALPEFIDQGLMLLEADPAYAVLAETWRVLLAEGANVGDLQALKARLFSSDGSMAALGYAELANPEAGAGEGVLVEVSIEAAGVGPVVPVTSDDP